MSQSDFDAKEFRQALGTFVTGITVVTTELPDGSKRGFTANSFTSVSLDPPLVLVCLAKTAFSADAFENATAYAINVLTENQRDISNQFASKVPDKFAGVSLRTEVTGSPIINDCVASFDCQSHEVVDAGDHIILIGRVVSFSSNNENPLGYHRGGYITFGMTQDAITASENPKLEVVVGALLEQNDSLLLLKDKAGQYCLPSAPQLSGKQGLIASLRALGLEPELGFLFAVFEDERNGTASTYYRGSVTGQLNTDAGEWFALDAIPLDKLPDDVIRKMVLRYVTEHQGDAFGVYVGDTQSGKVGVISN